MCSKLENDITFRCLQARKKVCFLNVISSFSFIGISLGVAVLIIVMSVMNGFMTELINKIVGCNSHITVTSYDESLSSKIKKMNLIGATFQMIIGKQTADNLLEFKRTGEESLKLKLEDVIKIIKEEKAKY